MHTSAVLVVAAAAGAAVAVPVGTARVSAAPVSASGVTTEGAPMHSAPVAARWGLRPDLVHTGPPPYVSEEDTEYKRELEKAEEKRDAARKHGVVCTIL
jgi:hypothetical protein